MEEWAKIPAAVCENLVKNYMKRLTSVTVNPASVPGRNGLQWALLSVSSAQKRSGTERLTPPSGVSRAAGSAISCWSSAPGHRASSSKHSRDQFRETGSLSRPLAAWKLLPDASPWGPAHCRSSSALRHHFHLGFSHTVGPEQALVIEQGSSWSLLWGQSVSLSCSSLQNGPCKWSLLSLLRVFEASAHRSMRKLYALKWKFHFMVQRSPSRPSQLPDWYSSGVLAGQFLHRVNPLHPEGLQGSIIGLPHPSWWLVSGQTPPCYMFPPEHQSSAGAAMWVVGEPPHSPPVYGVM